MEVLQRLERHFFASYSATPRDLGIFRVLFALWMIAFCLPAVSSSQDVPLAFFNPPVSVPALWVDPPSSTVLHVCAFSLLISLIFLAVGLCTRAASLATGVFVILLYSIHFSTGKINHCVMFFVVPIVLAFSSWGEAYSLDGWRKRDKNLDTEGESVPLAYLAFIISFAMVSAGVPKFLSGWLSLGESATLGHMISHSISRNDMTIVGSWASRNVDRYLFEIGDWFAVGMEMAFAFTFVSRRAFSINLAIATLFHFGVFLLFDIAYGVNVLAYSAFVYYSRFNWIKDRFSPLLKSRFSYLVLAIGMFFVGIVCLYFGKSIYTYCDFGVNRIIVCIGTAVAIYYLCVEALNVKRGLMRVRG